MTYEEYKKELTIALNNIASSGAINYALYKALYEFINGKKTVSELYDICICWTRDIYRNNDNDIYDDYECIYHYLDNILDYLENSILSKKIINIVYSFSDNNVEECGLKIGKFEFIRKYTGCAGNYWDGLIKGW